MGAITKEELQQGLEDLYEFWSNKTEINPKDARAKIAEGQAKLIADFVIGRQTTVTGTASGGAVNATGIIQE